MYFTKRKNRIKNAFLQRVVIKQQKKKIIKQIEKIIGGSLRHVPIPDYIDSGEIKRLRRMILEKQTEGDTSKNENDDNNKAVKKEQKLLKENEQPEIPVEIQRITMAIPNEITEEEKVNKESRNVVEHLVIIN